VGEIAVITLAGVVGTLLSQELASERVFRSWWFLGTVGLAFVSLLVVSLDQGRRLGRTRPLKLAPLGGLLIHMGLLMVILAAALKALFGVEAVVDVMEGETLPPTSTAWAVHKTGLLVSPLRVANPITLESVEARRYPEGDLKSLAVGLSLAGLDATAPREVGMALNQSVDSSGIRIFASSDYGPAALMEWREASGTTCRTAVLLKHERGHRFEGEWVGAGGERAYLRAEVNPSGIRPTKVEVRVMRDTSLLFTGTVRAGETVTLPSGGTLVMHGIPFWVRLHANRDPALWLIYLGFSLVLLGVTVRFTLPPDSPSGTSIVIVPHPVRYESERLPLPLMLMILVCVAGLTSCNGYSRPKARQLVERYNTVVSEAYRRGDVKLVDSVVGPNEGRKLTGLIGVRLDMGLTLDSKLISLEVLDARTSKDELQVRTREHWSYCERRIGTGQQVGEKSEDTYEMQYFFKRFEQNWLVDRIEFATPPKFEHPSKIWEVSHGNVSGHVADQSKTKEITAP